MTDIPMVVPLTARIARLALITTGEPTPKLHLFTSAFSVDELTTLANLTAIETAFDGYTTAGVALTMTTGYITPDLVPSNESQLVSIIMPNPVVAGATVYGGWIQSTTELTLCFTLPSPVPMTAPGQALKLMIEDSYPPGVPSVQVVP